MKFLFDDLPQLILTLKSETAGSVFSGDATTIGYYRIGRGLGVLLLHGAGQCTLVAVLQDTADRTNSRILSPGQVSRTRSTSIAMSA